MNFSNLISILLTLFLLGCQRESKPPNILFIAIDDLNDWVGCMNGRSDMHTPNIDRLADSGVLFTNAHCSAPACCPSRTSLLTGVSPSTSGVYSNRDEWRESEVLKDAVTIPEYFGSKGYTVKGCGKIFHALSWIQSDYGKDQNDPDIWNEFYPSKSRQLPESYWPEGAVIDSAKTVRWPEVAGNGTPNRPSYFFDYGSLGTDELMADSKVVDWAIEQLLKQYEDPLFLAVGLYRPHIPWFVPESYFDRYPLTSMEMPEVMANDLEDVSSYTDRWLRRTWQQWMIENDEWKNAVQAYSASITFCDAMVGRLLDGLKQSEKEDNTIVILWSDHGMHIGEKEHWEKFTLWEESTRVPLIFRIPGNENQAGRRCNEAVSLLDVYPTLVDVLGDYIPESLEGVSLKSLLFDANAMRREPALTTYGPGNHAVRSDRWRYISYANGDEELYDHKMDPNEYQNLAKMESYRDTIRRLAAWLPK